jgi:plastocyanin
MNTLLKKCLLTAAAVLCAIGFSLSAQTALTNSSASDVPTCTTVELGTTMTFVLSTGCGPGIAVDFDAPGSPIDDGTSDTQIALLSTDDLAAMGNEITVTFDQLGTFTFQCDVPDFGDIFGIAGLADQCFTVVEPSGIPTLGEWGLIILSLLILIAGVAFYRYNVRTTIQS